MKYLMLMLVVGTIGIAGCSAKGGLEASSPVKKKVDEPGGPNTPGGGSETSFEPTLKLDGVSMDGWVDAYSLGKNKAGEEVFQLRFFDKYNSELRYCDDHFYATERSEFDSYFFMNAVGKIGQNTFAEGNSMRTIGAGFISKKPFNVIYDAIGTFEISKGIVEFIEDLYENGVKLAVASSSSRTLINAVLEAYFSW